jgi:3-deoxy-manno-octulosonate cytidylyltransferase (CMP-KDO synthetase)
MKIFAVIPARYAATRFPGKLMQLLGNKSVIAQTYENTVKTGLFNEVWVATDSEIIQQEILAIGGYVVRSTRDHESGSDRIAEAIEKMDVDIVVNVQGDEPFIQKDPLEKLINSFNDPTVRVGSLMQRISEPIDIDNPNIVKVVFNDYQNALYFSRSPIPYNRNRQDDVSYFRHIGVYAFRKETLLEFTTWPMGRLENAEKLEQLRYLENNVSVRMIETSFTGIGIDTPEDLEKAKRLINMDCDSLKL